LAGVEHIATPNLSGLSYCQVNEDIYVSEEQIIFSMPENLRLKELKSWVGGSRQLEEEPPEELTRITFDTFDWRLFRFGTVLEITRNQGKYLLNWRRLETGQPLVQCSIKEIPKFAGDVVAPGLRRQLKEVLGVRALCPQVSVNSTTQVLRLIDGEEKTVMRFELRKDRVLVPQSTGYFKLPEFAYLFPYRGYRDAYERSLRQLTGKGRLQKVNKDPLVVALDHLGIKPVSFYGRPDFKLVAEQPAGDALRLILNSLLSAMERNIEGACNDEDPEFLHDFLQAERQIQCLLDRYSSVFPDAGLKRIREDFKWIEDITAAIRSLDIHLGLFDNFVSRVDQAHRPALEPLHQFMKEQKLKEHKKVRIPLQSPRYRKLMELLRRFLEHGSATGDIAEDGDKPVVQIAGRGILRLYREMLEKGTGVTSESPPSELLELHILCKRIGYQMEFFHSLFPEDRLTLLWDSQKRLQRNLYTYHDLHLQHRALRDYQNRMKQDQRTMPVWMEAIDLLIEDLDREERKERRKFPSRFKQFSDKKMRKRFQSLFSGKGKKK